MQEAWHSFLWYCATAFILVAVTTRFFLIDSEKENNEFVMYLMGGAGFFLSLFYFFLIARNFKKKLPRMHILYMLFAIINQWGLTILLLLITNSMYQKMFPVLFSFQLLITISSFVSEINYRQNL